MPVPRPILSLSPQVAERIAAGEVILHPASVLKELVENAIDANSTQISIQLEEGGTTLLEVIDNGDGIAYADLPLALKRHATSKIREFTELETLQSFGFRGEALPSIGAVAKLKLESRPRQAEEGGVVEMHGGEMRLPQPAGLPLGTRVQVRDLFYSTPARRKFLKSSAYEWRRCERILSRLALAHPDIEFKVSHQGKVVALWPVRQTLSERLGDVLGYPWKIGGKSSSQHLKEERGAAKLEIFYLQADHSFANNQQQLFFLNRRPIQDRSLAHALREAYRTLIMEHRYPGAVVFLTLPPDQFDVNIHPSKEEVRFVAPQALHQWILHLLRTPLVGARRHHLPSNDSADASPTSFMAPSQNRSEQLILSASGGELASSIDFGPIVDAPTVGSRPELFSQLRLLGQFRASYLVCEHEQGLLLIDQHAAHERILFEKYRRQWFDAPAPKQILLSPLLVRLHPAQQQAAATFAAQLEELGFEWEQFGGHDVLLRAVPPLIQAEAQSLWLDLLDELTTLGSTLSIELLRDRLVESLACHNAVRFNQQLAVEEMQELLKVLDLTESSAHCPHGRPTYITFSDRQLAQLFKRS